MDKNIHWTREELTAEHNKAYDLEITDPIQELNDLKEQVDRLSALSTVLVGLVVKGFGRNTSDILNTVQENFYESSEVFSTKGENNERMRTQKHGCS